MGFAVIAAVQQAHAVDLLADFQKAANYDPVYQTALADFKSSLAQARQSFTAYAPTGSLSNQRLENDANSRTTLSITQPLLNYQAFATFKQADPKKGFAEANFLLKQQDLTVRLVKGANAIILANENIKLNNAKIKALEQQYLAAKRKLELGQGTVTDLRDIEVKAAQAKSAQISYQNQLEIAAKQYASITGERPVVGEFVLPQQHGKFQLKQVEEYIDLTMQNNPAILAAKYNERVAELEVDRARGSFMPTLAATFSDSKSGKIENKYTAVVVTLPLNPSSYFANLSAQSAYAKSKDSRRDTEEKAKLDVDKLRSQINTGTESLLINLDAIKAAELSVEANAKSYEGGVRSAVDVLNATQTVFQVKSEYVTAVTSQTENVLSLMNLSNANPMDALETAYKYLFSR